jgi:hypothetical protein
MNVPKKGVYYEKSKEIVELAKKGRFVSALLLANMMGDVNYQWQFMYQEAQIVDRLKENPDLLAEMFLAHYKEQLPDKLKSTIRAWIIGKKI